MTGAGAKQRRRERRAGRCGTGFSGCGHYCPGCGIQWDTDEDRPACPFKSASPVMLPDQTLKYVEQAQSDALKRLDFETASTYPLPDPQVVQMQLYCIRTGNPCGVLECPLTHGLAAIQTYCEEYGYAAEIVKVIR